MIEIEKYPCKDVQEAKKKEREWFEIIGSKLNIIFPQRNKSEYYIDNRDTIISKVHIYANSHKDEISQHSKLYRVSNKEQIKERRSKLFVCECGKEINYDHKSRHLRTKVHNDLILCKNVTSV
jgi:hypothetical protein